MSINYMLKSKNAQHINLTHIKKWTIGMIIWFISLKESLSRTIGKCLNMNWERLVNHCMILFMVKVQRHLLVSMQKLFYSRLLEIQFNSGQLEK